MTCGCLNPTTAQCHARPAKTRRGAALAAGDSGRGGASQWPKWKRNSRAHLPVPLTAAAPAQNSSEPARGGGDKHGQNENEKEAPHCSIKQVPSHLGTTRRVPGHRWSSKVVGVAPATKKVAGPEEDEVGKWT